MFGGLLPQKWWRVSLVFLVDGLVTAKKYCFFFLFTLYL